MSKNLSGKVAKSHTWRIVISVVAGLLILTLFFSFASREALAQSTPGTGQIEDLEELQFTDEDGFKVDELLTAEEKAQLLQIAQGGLTPEEITTLKAFASQKIREFVPVALSRLEEKTQKTTDTRLLWVFLVIVVGIPVLAFIGFMIYPLVIRKKVQARVPGIKLGKLYGFYLPQALVVTLILLVLGAALWGIQFLNGKILGGIANPQIVLQKEALQNLDDQSEQLVEDYTAMSVSLAENLDTADPDKAVFDLILDNANQLKKDPLVEFTSNVVSFVMPFLTYISLVTFLIILVLFLLRIRPDTMRMLTYPVDALEAESKNQRLPDFESRAAGIIPARETATLTQREIAKILMWTEVKVLACFAAAVVVLSFLMSFALVFFFNPVAAMLLETANAGVDNFLQPDGSSSLLSITMHLMMLFVLECVVLSLVTFVLVLMRVQDMFRQRFAGNITWKQVQSYSVQVFLRFFWLLVVITLLGFGLPYIVDFSIGQLVDNSTPGQEPNWGVILLVIPVLLLVVFNLLFWLLRGFKMMGRLLKVSAAVEFNLPKPGTQGPSEMRAGMSA